MKTNTKRFFNLNPHRNDGFTLVELIVVIAILAILAAVAVPAYSGYIEKANKAGDETLLATINKAFVSACMENGFSQYDVDSAVIPVNADGTIGTPKNTLANDAASATEYFTSVVVDGENKAAAMNLSFAVYYAGNEGAAFKSDDVKGQKLVFNPATGMFGFDALVEISYNGTIVKVPQSTIDALRNSTFQTIGGESLAGQVDTVSSLAAALIQDGLDIMNNGGEPTGNAFFNMAMNPAYLASIGITDEILAEKSEDGTLATYLANSLILSAANASSGYDSETALSRLQSDPTTFIGDIKTRLNNSDQSALADAALIYGVYTSYVHATDPENAETKLSAVNGSAGLIDALTAMQNPEGDFASYMSGQGADDLDAYLEAMRVISDAASNDATSESVLQNGFTDEEIVSILEGILGN